MLRTILIAVLLISAIPPQSTWTQKVDENGIKVYIKDEPNSNVARFKAVMTIDASIHSLVAVFKDVKAGSEWIHECEEARSIKAIDFWNDVNYFDINVKVFWDRDMVMRLKMSQDTTTREVRIDISSAYKDVPKKRRHERVEKLDGYWSFKPVGSRTQVTYEFHMDPKLKDWQANAKASRKRAWDDPYNTFLNLRELVKKEPYRSANYSQLK